MMMRSLLRLDEMPSTSGKTLKSGPESSGNTVSANEGVYAGIWLLSEAG